MSQDPQLDDTKLKEFRMQLESALHDFERRGARVRRIASVAGIVYLINVLFGFFVLNGAKADSFRGSLAMPWMIVGLFTMVVGGYALVIYLTRYMPAIRRLRYDIQNSMIAELQQQVAALRDEVRSRP